MAIYSVHIRPGAEDDPILVKDGFSWPGFFFTLAWLALKRMWIVAAFALTFLLAASLAGSLSGAEDFWQFLSSLVLCLVFGFEGNDLRRWTLARRGYAEVALIEALDNDEAELKYFASRPGTATAIAVSRETSGVKPDPLATDALGLFSAPGGKP